MYICGVANCSYYSYYNYAASQAQSIHNSRMWYLASYVYIDPTRASWLVQQALNLYGFT